MIYVLSRRTIHGGIGVVTEVVRAFEVLEDAQGHACMEDATGLEWHQIDGNIWWACGAVKLVAWRITGVELVRDEARDAPRFPMLTAYNLS